MLAAYLVPVDNAIRATDAGRGPHLVPSSSYEVDAICAGDKYVRIAQRHVLLTRRRKRIAISRGQ